MRLRWDGMVRCLAPGGQAGEREGSCEDVPSFAEANPALHMDAPNGLCWRPSLCAI